MSHESWLPPGVSRQTHKRSVSTHAIICILALFVVVGIALDTKVVKIGSAEDVQEQGFSAEKYGPSAFTEIAKNVKSRAVTLPQLAALLKENTQQTTEKYGVGSPFPVFSVSFTGTVGAGKMGIYSITVPEAPASLQIRLQTGPAITGTDLRDATGTIQFGDFKNQIEFQNAGAAINKAMKAGVLTPLNATSLSGKVIKVVGVFRLLNPDNWLITPVKVDIQ